MKSEPQNIYDHPEFFAGYQALRQNDTGLNGVLEVPALRAALPELTGTSVLDLGCGFGDFARYARSSGAICVMAIDVSTRMLDAAARLTTDPAIRYLHCSIEAYEPDAESFEIAVSSLVLHYVLDYPAIVRKVFAALKPGGRFIFTVEHPVCTANPIGWIRDEHGAKSCWPLDRYQAEGARETSWLIEGVTKYHRTVSTYVNTLIAAGFRLERLEEPVPVAEGLALRPSLQTELRRPPFLLLAARRP
jgi:ubiquinone/menaquinone biosynthesis C-methylase UbiE